MVIHRWEEITAKIIRLLLPVIYVLPFVVFTSYYFPFIVPRNILFRIIIGIAIGGWLMLVAARPKQYLPKKNGIIISFMVLIAVLTLSSVINGDFLYGFWSTYERMEGLINFYFLLAFFVLLLGILRTENDFLKIIRFTLIASFLISLMAWIQVKDIPLLFNSTGGDRVSSSLGNATYLATYALFHVFFALYLFFKKYDNSLKFEFNCFLILDVLLLLVEIKMGILKTVFQHWPLLILFILPQALIVYARFGSNELYKKYIKWIFLVIIGLLNLFALFNTQTRGAFVGLAIAILVMLLAVPFLIKGQKLLKKVSISLLALVIIFVSSIFYFKDQDFIRANPTLRRVSEISFDDTTVRSRFLTWEAALKGWKEKPILGWGEEKFYVVFNKYFPTPIYRHVGSRIWFDRPHNVFLQPLIHGGIVGLAAYLAIFAFAYIYLWQYRKKTGDSVPLIVLGGLILAYMIQNAFVFDSLNSYILIILTFAYIVFLAKQGDNISEIEQTRSLVKRPPIVMFIIILLLTFYITVPKALANKSYVESLKVFNQAVKDNNNIVDSANNITEIINKNYLGKFETRHTFVDTIRNIIQNKAVEDNTALELGKIAEAELLKSIEEQPDNVRHYAFLTTLYMEMSRLDKSYANKNLELLEIAIPLSQTRTHLYYSQGRSHIVLSQGEEAIKSFTKAFELSPKVYDANLNLIAAYVTIGQPDTSREHIAKMPTLLQRNLSAEEYNRLAEIFLKLKYFSHAAELLQGALEKYPDSLELFIRITAVYVELGEFEKALIFGARAVELDPSLGQDFEKLKASLENIQSQ